MQLSQTSAEIIMKDMGMDDMPLISISPRPHPVPPDWFAQYKSARRKFMQGLAECVEELAFMNLTQEEFMDLVMGRNVPRNTSIRLRIPLAWGGAINPDNMFMCSTFPHSQNMDRFIISQSGSSTIWLPSPAKQIYIPAHTTGGGDGGNATEDRLAQMAAQIAASRGME